MDSTTSSSSSDDHFKRRLRAKREHANNPYRFHDLQTLSGLDDEARARQLLELLSSDPGVLAVMKKHKWSVGALCEMYPEGYVGVSDICVMGLNQNKGQKIFLRLRTDDLKGFRKLLSIKKVLYHELAHNEHSDHDDKFYMLMRQIEREVVELDWRKSTKGHVLGHGQSRLESDIEVGVTHSESKNKRDEISDSDTHRTSETESSNTTCVCGCLLDECSTCSSASVDVNPPTSHETVPLDPPILETQIDEVMLDESDHIKIKPAVDAGSAEVLIRLISDRIIREIDDTLASFYAHQQEPPDRVMRLRQAMYEMLIAVGGQVRFQEEMSKQSIAQLLETLTLLRDIIKRAKDSNDPKYKTLNHTKKIFQRVLADTDALPILYAVGFEQPDISSDYINLVRNDPVILYMFVDILNRSIAVSQESLVEFFADRA